MWEEDIKAIFPSNKHDADDYILSPLHYHCVLGLPTEEEASNVLLPDDDDVAQRGQLRMMVVMGLAASCDNIAAIFEMLICFSRLTLLFCGVLDYTIACRWGHVRSLLFLFFLLYFFSSLFLLPCSLNKGKTFFWALILDDGGFFGNSAGDLV